MAYFIFIIGEFMTTLKNLFAGYRTYFIGAGLIVWGVIQIANKQTDEGVNHIIAGCSLFTVRAAIK
jgi:hypothetical protein